MSRARLAFGLVLFAAASSLPAQSMPAMMKAKDAAKHAVAVTDAHTATMTADQAASSVKNGEVKQPVGGSAAKPVADSARRLEGTRSTQSAAGSAAVPRSVERPTVASFEREVYSYSPSGRRDPFLSLMKTGDFAPLITDIRVTTILYDPAGRNSVAVLRDMSSKEQYRVKVGQSVGRLRVAKIDQKAVTFTIEEFGFSRQETLALGGDTNKERKQ
jgi:hypothetical protein